MRGLFDAKRELTRVLDAVFALDRLFLRESNHMEAASTLRSCLEKLSSTGAGDTSLQFQIQFIYLSSSCRSSQPLHSFWITFQRKHRFLFEVCFYLYFGTLSLISHLMQNELIPRSVARPSRFWNHWKPCSAARVEADALLIMCLQS